jgi:hypothetical protein
VTGDAYTFTVTLGTSYRSLNKGVITGNTVSGGFTDTNGTSETYTATRGRSGPAPRSPGGPATTPRPQQVVAARNPQVGSIAGALASPSKAFSPLTSDLVNGAITVGLALFLTFPANLFNSTFQENYADIVAWWEKWTSLLFPARLRKAMVRGWRTAKTATLKRLGMSGRSASKRLERETGVFLGVLLVGSLLGALLDPSFGANVRTLLSFVAIVIAMVFGVALSGIVTAGYHRARKHGRVPYKLEALPVGLAIAAFCVVISRASGFSPGYLYGVICGVTFTRKLGDDEEGHVIALGALARVVLAVVAWLAWAGVTHGASKHGSFFGLVLVDDFLASLFVSSLVGTVISLFPLRFLPGHKLQQWHKGAWAAIFLVTLFVMVQVLLRPHSTSSGPSHSPLVTTIVLFAVFALGSLLFRAHFVRKRRTSSAGQGEPASVGTAEVEAGAQRRG